MDSKARRHCGADGQAVVDVDDIIAHDAIVDMIARKGG